MTDWLSRVFVEIAVSLSNSSRERSINSTERQAQGASATCNKNFTGRSQLNTFGQCQIYWEAGPQTSAQVSCTDSAPTVIQLHRLDNSIKSEPVTRFILGLVDFFPKKATFKLSLMSNDENKFLPIFQILHINNVWFLLKLAMALVTSIVMKFSLVWVQIKSPMVSWGISLNIFSKWIQHVLILFFVNGATSVALLRIVAISRLTRKWQHQPLSKNGNDPD